MDIKTDAYYSVKESAKILQWSERKLQRRAKKLNVRMIDGRYLFTGLQLQEFIQYDKTTRQTSNNTSNKISDLRGSNIQNDLDIITYPKSGLEGLKSALKSMSEQNNILQERIKELESKLKNEIPHQEKLKEAIEIITLEAMRQGLNHKVFTDEEYNDIIGTINEVEFQKEQVQYLRNRVEKQDTILAKLVNQVSERNYIEAKEKGLDKV